MARAPLLAPPKSFCVAWVNSSSVQAPEYCRKLRDAISQWTRIHPVRACPGACGGVQGFTSQLAMPRDIWEG